MLSKEGQKLKVLILTASAGAGHNSAANALHEQCKLDGGIESRVEDVLNWSTGPYAKAYSKGYIKVVETMPNGFAALYDRLDDPDELWEESWMASLERVFTRSLWPMVEDFAPDLIICTHFLPAQLLSWKKSKGKLNIPVAIVVTDFHCQALWLVHNYSQYFVHIEHCKKYMAKVGIDPKRITVSGIPVKPPFAEPKDQIEMRLKHGLHVNKTTIAMSTGGCAIGPVEEAVHQFLQLRHPAQVVVTCGNNPKLMAKVSAIARDGLRSGKPVWIKPIGFTQEMDELMAAADLIVAKPGGLTTCESLARGLPMVLVKPIPGQEDRNASELLQAGAAIRCWETEILADLVDELLDNQHKLHAMRVSALNLARPNAARDIVAKVKNMMGVSTTTATTKADAEVVAPLVGAAAQSTLR